VENYEKSVSQSAGLILNPGYPAHESVMLTTRPRYLVKVSSKNFHSLNVWIKMFRKSLGTASTPGCLEMLTLVSSL
jgi:hypothetical protein